MIMMNSGSSEKTFFPEQLGRSLLCLKLLVARFIFLFYYIQDKKQDRKSELKSSKHISALHTNVPTRCQDMNCVT